LKVILLLCAGLTVPYLFLLPFLFNKFIGLGLAVKIAVTFVSIFPLGFVMGFPFPTGIRLLEKTASRLLPWAWSANAFSTVINAVLAQGVALSFGYNTVWVLAAGAYLAAFLLFRFADHGHKTDS
jgi:hypothetical protein